ncbi:histidine kinase [Actinosynnema sp. NPDC020468]|uniref:sensor histidine kinase n=1 Tax=Actinosynnema sp. NPDC020468 TaxID=3154488 RepID=UPI0033D17ABE
MVIELLVVLAPAAMVLLADYVPFAWSPWAALAACALLPVRRHRPWLAAVLCLPGLIGGLGWPPMVVALYRIGRTSSRVVVMVAWALLAAVLASSVVVIDLRWNGAILTYAFGLFMSGAPTALGALITTRQRLTASLAEESRARGAELEARESAARASERARIAREIHDAVGHHVTLMAVESAALAATSDDPRTRQTATRLRSSAKEALAEMRTALGLLDSPPPVETLHTLVDRARAAGLSVTLDDRSPTPPPPTARAAYRVVQEALTNVTKHAPGSTVRVRLSSVDGCLHVTVINTPPPSAPSPSSEGGTGLHGLRERVRQAGGTLTTGRTPDGGWTVKANLPSGPSKVDKNNST